MSIDPRYLISPNLQQYFVDKDTGLPLSGGKVYFFEDNNRSTPKPMYQISGSPPSYTFSALPNPVTLSSVGTIQDGSGNDIIPYAYPLDSQGNIQLYYIEVYDSLGVLQFTREAWPPDAVQSQGVQQTSSTTNLIRNGQFSLHNNIPANIVTGDPAGSITSPVTIIAPGGWTFERPSGSTSVDTVIFNRIPSYTNDPTGSPRYEVAITSNGGSPADAFKNLCNTFKDVNKFASDIQAYSVFFSAKTISGGTFTLALNLIKNFGTGGDPQEVINVANFMITGTEQNFLTSFTWGDNAGNVIGPNDDDFCQLAFSFPTGLALDFVGTDFVYLLGDVNITSFPVSTNEDTISRSIIPNQPAYDGSSLGLIPIYTKNGFILDTSLVGMIYQSFKQNPGFSEYLCDGSVLRTDAYSPDGIPHSRLNNVLSGFAALSSTQGMSMFGNGSTYVTCSRCGTSNQIMLLSNNNLGVVTAVTDGGVPTGFTFNTIFTGTNSQRANAWTTSDSSGNPGLSCWVESLTTGTFRNSYSSTSPASNFFLAGNLISPTTPYINEKIGEIHGSASAKQFLKITSTGFPAASSYIVLPASDVGGSTTNDTILWFTVNGVGTQPSLGTAVYIRVNLFTTMTQSDVIYIISRILCGAQLTYIIPISGSSITPNSYFRFMSSNGQSYYVWYSLNGLGTDPLLSGAIGIPVTYTNTNTIQDIGLSTSIAINRMYFSLPDCRGQIVKGFDPTGNLDINKPNRFNPQGCRLDLVGFPGYIGSNQHNANLSHSHPVSGILTSGTSPPSVSVTLSYNTVALYPDTGFSGTGSNDPNNISANYFIKI